MGIIKQEFLVIAQREKRVKALIDTGANRSFISEKLARQLGASTIGPDSFKHSDGITERTRIVGLRIKQRNRVLDIYPLVSSKINEQLIIGVDFMQMYQGYIDMVNEKIELNEYAPKVPRISRLC